MSAWISATGANIHLYPGVQIVGGRSSTNPGPLLFTTTYPDRLFVIGEYLATDNVRITGIRLQGADQSVAEEDTPSSTGIWINSSLNVEIDNNEIYGWHIAAVRVHDTGIGSIGETAGARCASTTMTCTTTSASAKATGSRSRMEPMRWSKKTVLTSIVTPLPAMVLLGPGTSSIETSWVSVVVTTKFRRHPHPDPSDRYARPGGLLGRGRLLRRGR